mmetsp:Transcript_2048/g.5165  ORF Transcript_2048/g.5165 Transcript_2048/m.5165 type:complete len:592 (+) Transcript_2048:322-2097(+)
MQNSMPTRGGSRAHGLIAHHRVEGCQRPQLPLLDSEPLLNTLRRGDHRNKQHEEQRGADDHAFVGEHVLGLMAEPRPLEDAGVLGEVDLEGAVRLRTIAEHVGGVLVDGDGPVLHLAVHERTRRQLHPCHELVQVQGRLEIERHDVVVAHARVAILDCHAAQPVGRRVGRVTLARAHTDGQVGLLERDVNGAGLLLLLPGQDLLGGLRRDAVSRHVRGQFDLHGAGHVDRSMRRLLDEVRQVLAVVAIESHTLEPTVEDSRLVLPILWETRALEHHLCQHHVAHVVPNARVHELDAPLVRQVSAHLVADLLAALVDQVGQVLPSDLFRVYFEDTAGSWHVPSRSVACSHVQDHVHVLQGERAGWVQQLVVPVRPREEGMVLEEVHLGALLEVLGLTLCQQAQAQVIVDAKTRATFGWAHVQILVVAMWHDDLVASRLVDLRGGDGVVRVRLQGSVHLASEIALHRVRVVVHQHRVLRLQQWLHLKESGDWRVTRANCELCEVLEQPATGLSRFHMSASTNSGVRVEHLHARREDIGEMRQQLLGLRTSVLDGHHEAHRSNQLCVRTRSIPGCYRVWDAGQRSIAKQPPHAW